MAAISAVVVLLALAIAPSGAQALGNQVTLAYDRVQPGEAVQVIEVNPCPVVSNTNGMHVRAYLRDANGDPIGSYYGDHLDIGSYIHNGGGIWNVGILVIPEDAPLGAATVEVVCTKMVGSTFQVVQAYDPVPITIIGQTPEITVDKTHWQGAAHFQSIRPCDPLSSVRLELFSSQAMWTSTGMQFIVDSVSYVSADANGKWKYDLDLVPGMNNWFHSPGMTYSLRATCESEPYDYDSFVFTTAGEEYVALGDSYSSGEGSYNYDIDGGFCHRSSDAYAYYLANVLDLGTPAMGACSGAMTDDFFNASYDWKRQPEYLTTDTKVVTLTIGGNDVGFADVLRACVQSINGSLSGFDCANDTNLVNSVENKIAALAGTAPGTVTQFDGRTSQSRTVHAISDVIAAIHSAAPNAKIYIAGYPNLFGGNKSYFTTSSSAPGGAQCNLPWLAAVSYADAQWLNSVADDLNEVIEDSAQEAQLLGTDATFVPAMFGGHELCSSGTPWINDVHPNGGIWTPNTVALPESLHPTPTGHEMGYGTMFEILMQ